MNIFNRAGSSPGATAGASSARGPRTWVTVLATVSLLTLLGLVYRPGVSTDPVAGLSYPGESAGRLFDRHMVFYEGYEQVGGLERALHRLLFGDRSRVQAEALAALESVLEHFEQHPDTATAWAVLNTRSRIMVALAEMGRDAELQQAMDAYCSHPEAEVVCESLRFAYAAGTVPELPIPVAQGLRQLPVGWTEDRVRLRAAERVGNRRLVRQTADRLRGHGAELRRGVLALAAVIASVVASGLAVFVLNGFGRRLPRWRARVLDTPWPFAAGFAVFVRAGLLGLAMFVGLNLAAGPVLQPNHAVLWATLFASLPLVWLMHRRLLRPLGLGFRTGFGLTFKPVGLLPLLLIIVMLTAIEWFGSLGISWAAWQLGEERHWAEGIHERWIWSGQGSTLLSAVDAVVWAPLFEELGFRGLLYVTLRSRLRPLPAALLSAGLFGLLHLHSLAGFLSVFWSGLVLCGAFERFRSLLPCVAVHAASNVLSLSLVLLFYR